MKLREEVFHPIDYGDDVGAGLTLNIQNDGGLQIGPGSLLRVFHAVDNGGDVGEPHRRTIAVGNDERPVAVGGNELIVRADGISLVQAVKSAFGLVDVGLAENRAQVLKTQAVGSQCGGVRLDAHCRPLAAADADETNAGELRDFLSESGVGKILDFRQRQRLGGERQREDGRIGGINLAVDRRIGESLGEKIGSAIDGRLDLLLSDIDIQVQIKLQSDHRAPEGTCGGHLI